MADRKLLLPSGIPQCLRSNKLPDDSQIQRFALKTLLLTMRAESNASLPIPCWINRK